jgi:hypothetical protein
VTDASPGRAAPAPLDPIVSLAVGSAESPGAYAFLLGSGVSRDAGVPTGGEVLSLAVADLYRLEHSDDPDASDEKVATWAEETGHASLSYSEVLERLCPDPADRQSYLEKYFKEKHPSETHRLLAQLAADGLAHIFVTTNFDRLLEDALRDVGVTPVVITADDDLRRATEREHARCYVLKVHGDYLQQTIRNTARELAKLDPKVAVELQEVLDRYGLVVIGYSGSDAAVAECLRARNSRRGAYWVARSEPAGAATSLIEAMEARVIRRDTAAGFLTDLSRRIAVFRAHPSGDTPQVVAAEIIALLRKGDRVGLAEKLKDEWRALERRIAETVAPRASLTQIENDVSKAVADELTRPLERMLAALFPLIEHEGTLFVEQLGQMRREIDHVNERDGGWPEVLQWVVWQLAQACGAYAMSRGRYELAAAVLRFGVEDRKIGDTLSTLIPSHIGQVISAGALEPPWRMNAGAEWEQLGRTLNSSTFLRQAYPELAEEPGGARRWMDAFNFIACFNANREKRATVIGYWSMRGDGAEWLAQRLARDPAFTDELARGCFGIGGSELVATIKPTMNAAVSEPGRSIIPPGGGHMYSDAVYQLPDPPKN